MEDLSLHMLDIVENSLRCQARLVQVFVSEDVERDLLTLEISDDGKGMDAETCARATGPFFTTKPGHGTGLGLALLDQAAREAGGELRVSSSAGVGTTVRATFRWSHPDCRPLGDISATLEALVVGNPAVDFVCEQRRGADIVRFDTREVRHTWST
jgi:hypothetical protein